MQSEANNRGPAWWLRTIIIGRKPGFTFIRIVVLVVTTFVVFRYVLLPPVRITGPSMLPTLSENSVHFVNRLAYFRHGPRRGDVVSIRLAGNSIMYMKRIVGLPGETVEFSDGRLLINGEVLEEPYVKSPYRWDRPPQKLGPDEYFVVGDNRIMPIDDHYLGAATRDRIVGKLLL
jgi:signal peptidase I